MATSTTDPITAVCVVVDPNKCPPNFELLLKSNDKKDDCDLWKDGVFKSKVTRYLCYSRVAPTYSSISGVKEVLGDLVIQNEKEIPPPGFKLIEKTIDTCEKATNKKQICIRMIPVSATTDAISEIIILSKSKRAPVGYTSAGDVNGLLLCFKMSKIPPTGNASSPPLAQNAGNQLNNDQYSASSVIHSSVPAAASQTQFANSTENASKGSQNPLSGVPFRLNPRFADDLMFTHLQSVPALPYKSLIDIEKEFNYAFNLESSTVSQTRM